MLLVVGANDGAVKVRNVPLRGLARRFLCCFLVVALFAQAPALALTALPSSSASGAASAVPARPAVRNAGLENAHLGISAFLVRFALLRCAGEAWNHALSRACVYGGPPWFVVHRYYDPATGRYLTPDPLGDGLNPYGYAHGNPLALADPMGLCAAASTLGYYVAGAIAAAAGVAAAPWVAAAFAVAALVAATDTLSTELANYMNPGSDISAQGSEALQEALGFSKETADTAYELFQAFLGGGAASGLGGGHGGGGAGQAVAAQANRAIVVDTNALIDALDSPAAKERLRRALSGRTPVVSPASLLELTKGVKARRSASEVSALMADLGARVGTRPSGLGAKRMRQALASQGRALARRDSQVLSTAQREGLQVLSADKRFLGRMRDLGFEPEVW